MRRAGIVLFIVLCSGRLAAQSQVLWPFNDMLSRIRENGKKDISYDYQVILENVTTGKQVDSMYGHLVSGQNRFSDSNTIFHTAKNGNLYCKLDHTAKTVVVYDLAVLSAKMKMPLIDQPNRMVEITEQLLIDNNIKAQYDLSDPRLYRLIFDMPGQPLSYVRIDFNRTDYTIAAARFMLSDERPEGESGNQYRRIFNLYHVSYAVPDAAFDLSRIFTMNNGHAVMSRHYAHYKLNNIIP